ncbi:MAG TPA: hypothetical protein PKW37_07685 [Salinivirgaceae bacterium]|nr:hypothetical protein [Salinivirgaceae bacterium]
MTKTKVALIYGGFSREKEISENSAKCIKSTLDPKKYEVYPILIDKNGWFYKSETETNKINKTDFSFTADSKKIIPDIAYIIIHGTPGENGILQSYLDLLNIPYTTCNAFTSALTFNKAATKYFLSQHNIKTAPSILLRKNDIISTKTIIEELGLPMFVKPNNGGSSFGATKVNSNRKRI